MVSKLNGTQLGNPFGKIGDALSDMWYNKLYHGTDNVSLDAIKKEGFKTNKNVTRQFMGEKVYTTPDKSIAEFYANERARARGTVAEVAEFKVPWYAKQKMGEPIAMQRGNMKFNSHLLNSEDATRYLSDNTNDLSSFIGKSIGIGTALQVGNKQKNEPYKLGGKIKQFQNAGMVNYTTPNDTIRDPNILKNYSRDGQTPQYVVHNQDITNTQKPKELKWWEKALDVADDVLSAPQRAATWAVTGTYQNPSQAMGLDPNSLEGVGVDLAADPVNLLPFVPLLKGLKGARAATKAAEVVGKAGKVGETVRTIDGALIPSELFKGADYLEKFKDIGKTANYFDKYKTFDKYKDIEPILKQFTITKDVSLLDKISKTGAGVAIINDLIRQSGDYNQTVKDNYTPYFASGEQKKPQIQQKLKQTFKSYKKELPKKVVQEQKPVAQNTQTPVVQKSELSNYPEELYYTRPRHAGEEGSAQYDGTGAKYSLLDVFDKTNRKRVATYDPKKNKLINNKFGGKIKINKKSDWEIVSD